MLKRLTHLGVDESLPRHETRHVVLTNQYALFLLGSMLLSAVGPDRATLLPEVQVWLTISTPLVAATLLMNWRKWHTVATTWLLAVYLVMMGRIAMLEPLETNHAVILLINAMVAWFLLPPSKQLIRLAITVPSAAAAIALPLWLKASPPPPQLPTFDLERIAFGNMALISIALVFIAVRSATEIARAEAELLAERKKTETLLKREVAYQVAERSRELGAAASRAERPFLEPSANFSERYETVRPLGEGAMAAVFEVSRKTDGRRMALKVMKGLVSAELAARFAREAEIGARVQHANLVEILDVGVTDAGAPFLAMELLAGGSLEAQRDRFGDLPWALGVLRDVTNGLGALHAAGVVHRDLKPANVLIDQGRARVADYGIARLSTGDLSDTVSSGPGVTRTGHWVGTPLYMAPEALRGGSKNVGAPADMFALGLMAYELFTTRHPFTTPPVMLLMSGLPLPTVPPLVVAGVEAEVLRLVHACVSEDPSARPTAAEVLEALA